jgi:hypothetical protein
MSIDRMDDPGSPLMDGVSVSAGRQRYWKQIDMAPVGASVRLIVADRAGHLRAPDVSKSIARRKFHIRLSFILRGDSL